MLGTLLKVYIRGMIASLFRGKRKNGATQKTSARSLLLFGILFAFVFIAFGYALLGFFYAIGTVTVATHPWLIYALMGLLVFCLDFFMTIFTAKSQLFEAKDNELLLSLPVKPRDILLARMLTILLTDYLFELMVAVPVMIAWFMLGQFSWLGMIAFVVSLVFMPLLALSLACLVGWILSLISAHVKHPQIVTTILSLTFLCVYMAFCMGINEYINLIVNNSAVVADAISTYLPMFSCLGYAIAYGDILSLFFFVLWMAIPFALTCIILAYTFTHIITTKRGGGKVVYRERRAHHRSQGGALLIREFRRLISSPTYLMNAGLGVLFIPIIGVTTGLLPSSLINEFIFSLTGRDAIEVFSAFAVIGMMFAASLAMFTAPSISLEGQAIYDIKALPIPGSTLLFSKLWMHLLIVCPVSLVTSLVCVILLSPSFIMGLFIFVTPLLFDVMFATVGLCMNIAMPRFDWDSEVAVVKQSASVGFTMLINMFGTMLLSAASVILGLYTSLPTWAILLMFSAVPAIVCSILLMWIYRRGNKIVINLG